MSYEADKLRRDMAKDPMVRRAEPWVAEASGDGRSPIPLVADGVTLRDWFAGQALISFANFIEVKQSAATAKIIADLAYEMADAMLAARSKVRP